MDPNRKITKKQLTNKFDSKVINRQYFHRKTGLQGQTEKKNSTTAVQHSDRKKNICVLSVADFVFFFLQPINFVELNPYLSNTA